MLIIDVRLSKFMNTRNKYYLHVALNINLDNINKNYEHNYFSLGFIDLLLFVFKIEN